MLPTIAREDDVVVMIDQRKLPAQEVYVRCKTVGGSRARDQDDGDPRRAGHRRRRGHGHRDRHAEEHGDRHAEIRRRVLQDLRADGGHAAHRGEPVLGDRPDEAVVRSRCGGRRVGRSNQGSPGPRGRTRFTTKTWRTAAPWARLAPPSFLPTRRSSRIATPGALATAGYGTALGVIRGAVEAGKQVAVFADETRPFLQGARLTAWELVRDDIPTTVITDNMAGALMRQGRVNFVVVGADRIAANGDTANKIGTYSVAVLAREHDIPFYVAAPLSTIDLENAGRRRHPHRGAQRQRGHPCRRHAARAGGRVGLEPGVRRHAASADCWHHHRARHFPRALHGVAAAGIRKC